MAGDAAPRQRSTRRPKRPATGLGPALDLLREAVVLVDVRSRRVVEANRAACDLLGCTRDALQDDGGLRSTLACLAALPQGQRPSACKEPLAALGLRYTRSDGDAVSCEARRKLLRQDGRWLVLATLRDASDASDARDAAPARAELLASALDGSSDIVLLIDRERMAYIDANEAALQLFKLSREQLLRTPPWAISRYPIRPEEMAERFDRLIAQAPEPSRDLHVVRNDAGEVVEAYDTHRKALRIGGRWVIVVAARDVTESKAAQARQELLAGALNGSPNHIYFVDRERMAYIDVNDSALQYLGVAREELLRRNPWEVIRRPTARAELEELYDRLIAQAPQADRVVEVVHDDNGDIRWASEAVRWAQRIDGRWVVIVMRHDVGEALRQRTRVERFASALDLSADAVFLMDRATMRYIDFNQTACRLLGVTRDVLLQRAPDENSPQLGGPGGLAAVYDDVIARSPDPVTCELAMRRSDGTLVPCEVTRKAIRSEGRWVIVATARDITERKKALARMELFTRALDLSADAMLLVDHASLAFIDVNRSACELFGYTRDQFLAGSPRGRLTAEERSPAQLAALYAGDIARAPSTITAQVELRRRDGSVFPGEVRRQALRIDDRWVISISMRDITERRDAEQQIRRKVLELSRSNQELERFAYVASHDLSEPLRMVASYTQLLQRRYAAQLDEDAREFMGYIVGGAQRMKQLIDDLLTYSRAGRQGLRLREFPLDAALDKALANLSHAIAESHAVIEREPLPVVLGDPTGMQQVFQNLIGNAIKFRRTGVAPQVQVRVADAGAHWIVSVQDNGIGIAPEYFERIFVIFQRLHGRETYEGTGIGLAICKKVVERVGGRIALESTPGQGTSFHVHLPKAPPQDLG